MTRRAAGRNVKVLSLNQYVHRATLGLPKAERLDAAAELRAHLLERVTELEQKGFARDEAEFLAVRAMGDPQVTNRGLLSHAFTVHLGWCVLAAALMGGGSFSVWQNVPLPFFQTGSVGEEALTNTDLKALFSNEQLPRSNYKAVQIHLPPKTQWVYSATVGPFITELHFMPLSPSTDGDTILPRSINTGQQFRNLIGVSVQQNSCGTGKEQLLLSVQTVKSEQLWGHTSCTQIDISSQVKEGQILNSRELYIYPEQTLKLNTWKAVWQVNSYTDNYKIHRKIAGFLMTSDYPLHRLKEARRNTTIIMNTGDWKKYSAGLPQPLTVRF